MELRSVQLRWRRVLTMWLCAIAVASSASLVGVALEPTVDAGSMDLAFSDQGVAAGWEAEPSVQIGTFQAVTGVRGKAQEISTERAGTDHAYLSVRPKNLTSGESDQQVLSFWYRRTGSNQSAGDAFVQFSSMEEWRLPLPSASEWVYVEVLLPAERNERGTLAFWVGPAITLQVDEVGLRSVTPEAQAGELAQHIEGHVLTPSSRSQLSYQVLESGLYDQLWDGVDIGKMDPDSMRRGLATGWSGWNREGLPLEVTHSVIPGGNGGTAQRISTDDPRVTAASIWTEGTGHFRQPGDQTYTLSFRYRLQAARGDSVTAYVAVRDWATGEDQRVLSMSPTNDWRWAAVTLDGLPQGGSLFFVIGDDTTLDVDDVSLTNGEGVAGYRTMVLPGHDSASWDAALEVPARGGRLAFMVRHQGLAALLRLGGWPALILVGSLLALGLANPPVITILWGAMQGVVSWEPAPADVMWVLWSTCSLLTGGVAWSRLRKLGFVNVGLAVFFVGNILALYLGNGNGSGTYALVTLYGIAIFYSVVGLIRTSDTLVWLRSGLVAAAAINALAALASVLGGERWSVLFSNGNRAMGFFKDPNVMGPFLVFGIMLLMEDVDSRPTAWLRLLQRTLQVLLILGVLLTQGRASVAVLLGTLGVYTLLRFRTTRASLARTATSFVAAIGTVIVVAATLYELSLLDVNRLKLLMEYDITNRFPTQFAAIKMALSHPWGIGPGASESTFGLGVHSLYIRALVETGWSGFVGLISFLGYTTWRLWRCIQSGNQDTGGLSAPMLMATWLGLLANSLVIDTLHWRHLWILAGLIWVYLLQLHDRRVSV